MTTEQLLSDLRDSLGKDLKSVVLFGSAAAGDFLEGVSGIDVLIVTEKLGAPELAALAVPLGHWTKAGNPPPHLFAADELAASADVFPIELTDLQQSRRVLAGDDPIANITIENNHYRLQLERELKTRLLLLRRNYLTCEGRTAELARLMTASISTFLVLFRAALRLFDDAAPPEKAAALTALAKHLQFDARPFQTVLELKQRQRQPTPGEMEPLFAQYLTSIETVVQAVDRHLRDILPQRENS